LINPASGAPTRRKPYWHQPSR